MITQGNRQSIFQKDSTSIGVLLGLATWLLAGPAVGLLIASSIPNLHPNSRMMAISKVLGILSSILISFLLSRKFSKQGKQLSSKALNRTSWIIGILYVLFVGPILIANIID